jgi:hypothetical protein
VLRLLEPMLARAGPIPITAGWVFEPKLDGFRCLICTHGARFRARSRRGWEMAERPPGFLDGVICLGQRAEHPLGHRPQMCSLFLESPSQKLLFVHRSRSSATTGHRSRPRRPDQCDEFAAADTRPTVAPVNATESTVRA